MKRLLWVLSLTLIISHISVAQDAPANSAPPDVVILKLTWSKQAPAPPFSHTPIRNVKDFDPRDLTHLPDPNLPSSSKEEPPLIYFYAMRIKNTGAKTITGVVWEYVFTDPKSQGELGRRRFYGPHSDEHQMKIHRNQSVTLNAKSSLPPTDVVRVQDLGKDEKSPYLERVEIKCVMYADGSSWKPPAAKASDCEDLEVSKGAERRK